MRRRVVGVVGAGNDRNRNEKGRKAMLHENVIGENYPTVLALDLAQHFGYACNTSIEPRSGHIRLATATRERLFCEWMQYAMQTYKPSVVVYEEVKRHMSTASAHSFGGYRALMNCVCQSYGIETVGIGVKVVKMYITGNGNAPKNAMIAAIQKRGYNVTDDNEADAIGVLLTALETGVVERVGE
jgi:Holliday junction resolvasome RuvABC endonuclease subunit